MKNIYLSIKKGHLWISALVEGLPLSIRRIIVWLYVMLTQIVPESVDDFLLPASQEMVSEVYVIGTQETTGQRKEWEVLLQQTLGPSHLLIHSASLGELCLLLFLRRDLIWFCSGIL